MSSRTPFAAGGREGPNVRLHHVCSEGIYVVGETHTNTIEGFWSLVKRGLGGVYHSVSKKVFAELPE
jgi:hypothetical protein